MQLYQHEWELGKREIVWKHCVFTQFRVFPISTSVDITLYQYGKNVSVYLFYNLKHSTEHLKHSTEQLNLFETTLTYYFCFCRL
jgi:hypothetical protein